MLFFFIFSEIGKFLVCLKYFHSINIQCNILRNFQTKFVIYFFFFFFSFKAHYFTFFFNLYKNRLSFLNIADNSESNANFYGDERSLYS